MTGDGAAFRAAPIFGGHVDFSLRLDAGVFGVRIEDQLVFLDLMRDGYSVLTDADRWIELDASSDRLRVANVEMRETLTVEGLASCASSFARRTPPPGLPSRTLAAGRQPPATWSDRFDFARVHLTGPWRHRIGSLAAMARWAGRGRPETPHPVEETMRRARVFRALMSRSLMSGDCLFRSHLLLRFLRLGGCDARWVFAVRTWPFAAHCWLQVDGLVLNDAHERLRGFHPIVAV